MFRKPFILSLIVALIGVTGCVKETYDMNMLSKKAHISPTLAISAARGDISFSDLVEPSDTVVFDENNFVSIVFKKDSVINFNIDDYSDFNTLGEFHFNKGYEISPLPVYIINDTITYDPGNDIEIERLAVNTGAITYQLKSKSLKAATFAVTFPSVYSTGNPVTEIINIGANQTVTGSFSINSTDIDFSTDLKQRYNRLPIICTLTANTGSFSLNDSIYFKLDMLRPDFDYIKGYFGQQTETIDPDTLDLDIKDILDHITGTFLLSSPSLKLNYSNSFALPIQVNLQAKGYKGLETVNLGLDPVTLNYPAVPAEREKKDVFNIDRNNSSLPELVSMPPEKVIISGSALMNPGGNTGTRDNYLFGDSHFNGDLEIEVPLELRIDNLQFADTVDNFLKSDVSDNNSPVKPEDFDFLRIDITAKNGFPLGVSTSIILFDSATQVNKYTIDANDMLNPAPVDVNGKVTGPIDCETSIDITKDFWDSIDLADKIIFIFKLNSTDNGSKDVKIYSDYKINFKASLVLKPDIRFDLK
jgi:hypothetical protein